MHAVAIVKCMHKINDYMEEHFHGIFMLLAISANFNILNLPLN